MSGELELLGNQNHSLSLEELSNSVLPDELGHLSVNIAERIIQNIDIRLKVQGPRET